MLSSGKYKRNQQVIKDCYSIFLRFVIKNNALLLLSQVPIANKKVTFV